VSACRKDKLIPAEDAIDDTLAYIRRHVAEDLRAQVLAERCRLSERHFVRLFRKRTGRNPHPFVQQVRMQTACEYLSGTTLTIAEIADAVGYRDLPSFYRVFRQVVGTTPRVYKLCSS
jgi:AraC family L-rhamnose operon transcriptional activator RhaR